MTTVDPAEIEAAAETLTAVRGNLRAAADLAALHTTQLLPSAADEVSTALTALFNAHGQWYQQLAQTADERHQQFIRALSAAGDTYQQTELTSAAAMGGSNQIAFIMGGTALPNPTPAYLAEVDRMFIQPYFPGATPVGLSTPEQLTPLFGSMPLDRSIAIGLADLQSALAAPLSTGQHAVVFGHSQSAMIATEEIRSLMAAGAPYTHQLSFILAGNPNNPVGGLAERFTGGYIPGLGIPLNGATPPNSPYSTWIFTNQYDGVADFPQYPLNLVSDANALAGIALGNHDYSGLSPLSVANALVLPTSPGYSGNTQYLMALTQNLPLVQPLRWLPSPYGNAIADLLQPDLRVIVDMGYGSGEYANLPTPASLFEIPNPGAILPALAHGAIQGPTAALVDLGLLPSAYYPMGQYPFSPVLDPGLNFPISQTQVTGVSVLMGFEGSLARSL